MVRGPNLRNDEKHQIACTLLENSKNLIPTRGLMKSLAIKFQVNRRTIFEVWKVAKYQREHGMELSLDCKMLGKVGRPKLEVPKARFRAASKKARSTYARLGKALGVSPSTCRNWKKQGKVRSHTSAVHPTLTTDNKYLRLNFVISKLYFDRFLNAVKFRDMDDTVHGDEKWYYMHEETARYYLEEDEPDPYRSCKSKRFITKIMFMAAVSRPIYAENGDLIFDGKIGIFPFTCQEPAKRNSKNRPRGTMETKAIESVNKNVIKDMMINNIIPAIKTKWPPSSSKTIYFQQDNARPHVKASDPDFIQAATSDGFNIMIQNQPANSPDLNVLDLGFFNSIQSLQIVKEANTVDELVQNVLEAWEEEPAQILDDVWLSLQNVMLQIMDRMGHNDYKLPHMGKQAQRRAGTLQRNMTANEDVVKGCMTYLAMVGEETNLDELFNDLGLVIPD